MPQVGLAGLKCLKTEPVVARTRVLLYIAAAFQGSQYAEDVIFVQIEQLGKLGHSQLRLISPERFKDIERMVHRVDDIIAFFPFDHPNLCITVFEAFPM